MSQAIVVPTCVAVRCLPNIFQNSYSYMVSNINHCNHRIYYHPDMHGISKKQNNLML